MPSPLVLLLPLLLAPSPQSVEVPQVHLSAQHKKLTTVAVGQAFPAFELEDLKGKKLPLDKQLGKNVTLVVVLGKPNWMTRQLLADLPHDVAKPYTKRGVRTLVITTGRKPTAKEVNADYQLLADPDGKAFAQLGTGRLPRVYVIDTKGKIAWFDIEYSRSTRRELRQTLVALVGKPKE